MGLRKRLLITGVGLTLGAIGLAGTVAWVGDRKITVVGIDGSNRMMDSDLNHLAISMLTMAEGMLDSQERASQADLRLAHEALVRAGGLRLSTNQTAIWQAVNQYTHEASTIVLPKAMLGGQWTGQIRDFTTAVPVVDDLQRINGGTSTIFQRMNARGDMLRVATSVAASDGKRAIGTFIPAVNPDGGPNPVLRVVLDGKNFVGRAFVVNGWYESAYEPITGAGGGVIGMLYSGTPEKHATEFLTRAMIHTKVGKSGYIWVVNATGSTRGRYIVSQDGHRDGERCMGFSRCRG